MTATTLSDLHDTHPTSLNSLLWIVKEIRKAQKNHDLGFASRWIALLKENSTHEEYFKLKKLYSKDASSDWCHIVNIYQALSQLEALPLSDEMRCKGKWNCIIDKESQDITLRLYQQKTHSYAMRFFLSADILATDIPIMNLIAVAGEFNSSLLVFDSMFRFYSEKLDDVVKRGFVMGLKSPMPLVVSHRDVAMNVLFSKNTPPDCEDRGHQRARKHSVRIPNIDAKNGAEHWWSSSILYFYGESFPENTNECYGSQTDLHTGSPSSSPATADYHTPQSRHSTPSTSSQGSQLSNARMRILTMDPSFRIFRDGSTGTCDVHFVQGIVTTHRYRRRIVPRIDLVIEVDPKLGIVIPQWFIKICVKMVWKNVVEQFVQIGRWIQEEKTQSLDRELIESYKLAMRTNPLYLWMAEAIDERLKLKD
eukprot:GHVH01010802.1.p1 GENE.GHVH01010802.1~~GHVH01010802.1.p1  ORF type:complete len:422 (-),score=53.47 GHVH01010802.1:209-1474(-)